MMDQEKKEIPKTAQQALAPEQAVISKANEEAFAKMMQDAIQRPAISWEEALGEEFKLIHQDPSQSNNSTPSSETSGDTGLS